MLQCGGVAILYMMWIHGVTCYSVLELINRLRVVR